MIFMFLEMHFVMGKFHQSHPALIALAFLVAIMLPAIAVGQLQRSYANCAVLNPLTETRLYWTLDKVIFCSLIIFDRVFAIRLFAR